MHRRRHTHGRPHEPRCRRRPGPKNHAREAMLPRHRRTCTLGRRNHGAQHVRERNRPRLQPDSEDEVHTREALELRSLLHVGEGYQRVQHLRQPEAQTLSKGTGARLSVTPPPRASGDRWQRQYRRPQPNVRRWFKVPPCMNIPDVLLVSLAWFIIAFYYTQPTLAQVPSMSKGNPGYE